MSELEDIEQLAEAQRKGGFTTESDAMAALELVVRLARAIMTLREEMGLA